MQYRSIVVMLILMAALSSGVMAQNETVLRVVTHDSFAYSEEVMQRFTEQTGIVVEVVRAGDAGTLVNQAVLTRSNPLGDVLFGVDNTFLSRALAGDIFIPYESPALSRVHEEFVPDADVNFAVTPIDFGDVCLNYDVQYFEQAGLDVPDELADLADPSYRSLLTVQNPATSSPGLAFLITTIAVFGEEGDYTYLDFWRDLVANDVLITDGWTDAYFGHFSGAGGSDARARWWSAMPAARLWRCCLRKRPLKLRRRRALSARIPVSARSNMRVFLLALSRRNLPGSSSTFC